MPPPVRPPVTALAREHAAAAEAALRALGDAADAEAAAPAIAAHAEAGCAVDCQRTPRCGAQTSRRRSSATRTWSRRCRRRGGRRAARWLRRVAPEISQLVVQRKDEKRCRRGKSASLEGGRVLSAYAAAGRPAEAQEAMRAIAEAGLTPDRVSFNT